MPFFNKVRRWFYLTVGLSSKEFNGMLIFIPLIIVLLFSQPVYRAFLKPQTFHYNPQKLDSLLARLQPSVEIEEFALTSDGIQLPFMFDPNNASYQDFLALGFDNVIAKRIISYRNTGARFLYKEDLLKIRHIDSLHINQLWPYIRLPERTSVDVASSGTKTKAINLIRDLNYADTTDLKSIYGIGSVLSRRIVNYRNNLGGFVDLSQLKEIYGLKAEVIEQIHQRFYLEPDFVPAKINVNHAEEKLLTMHPYIDKKAARAIISYRMQHGKIQSADDLKKIYLLPDSIITKVLPYIEF